MKNTVLVGALTVVLAQSPIAASAAAYKTVYSFGDSPDGAAPIAALISQGETLYGTTKAGGSEGYGTVFQFDPKTKKELVVHTFLGGEDGQNPYTGVLYQGGFLYGTTFDGGSDQYGTVYKIDLSTGDLTTIYAFTGMNDGEYPRALMYLKGSLYGIAGGGAGGAGVVFKIDAKTGADTTFFNFPGAETAANPTSIIYKAGLFYGTTNEGGPGGTGTIFELSLANANFSVLHNFGIGSDGQTPEGIVLDAGTIYGSTRDGGTNDVGTLFKLDLQSGAETVIYNFNDGNSGCQPVSAPSFYRGALYGTAPSCGTQDGLGTIYKVNARTGAEKTLHLFSGSPDGDTPQAGLFGYGGYFYGCAFGGGAFRDGTLFKIKD